ncbi:uncharacterized protein LOC117120199 [Anneissia japonica]|uniref:uncharacterized protein LOC117120199 n=1 Tax=Anneissia japonica TaxID=1529436 RepID=UPI001425829A|nr:uncharacterized protein LOC117120199 [Anneissia japonica]
MQNKKHGKYQQKPMKPIPVTKSVKRKSSNRSDEDEDDISPRKRKSVKSKTATGKRTVLVEENCNKTEHEQLQMQDQKHGKHQQSPTKPIPVTKPVKRKSSNRSDEDEGDVSPQKRESPTKPIPVTKPVKGRSNNSNDEDEDDVSPQKGKVCVVLYKPERYISPTLFSFSAKSKTASKKRTNLVEENCDNMQHEQLKMQEKKHWKYQQSPMKPIPVTKPFTQKSRNRSDEDEDDVSSRNKKYKTSTQASETWIGKASQRGTKKTEKTSPERTTSVGRETNNIIPDL